LAISDCSFEVAVLNLKMDKAEFKQRTKAFAIGVARFCKSLPFDKIIRHYVDQIVRSSASVGAN
jgi:hypothetical protein